jgi:hypothetical protein
LGGWPTSMNISSLLRLWNHHPRSHTPWGFETACLWHPNALEAICMTSSWQFEPCQARFELRRTTHRLPYFPMRHLGWQGSCGSRGPQKQFQRTGLWSGLGVASKKTNAWDASHLRISELVSDVR